MPLGLNDIAGTTVMLEGIRRCGNLGVTVAYVYNNKPFYLVMGFKKCSY